MASEASLRLITAVGIALSVAVWPHSSAAQSEAEKEVARGMMESGDAAYDAGRYADALERYRQADAIVGVPTTGLAVALALEKLGRLRESREVALRVSASKPVAGEPRLLADARGRAALLARQLDAAIPTLQVAVRDVPPTVRVSLVVDGAVVPSGLSAPMPLDPGNHEYEIAAEGYRPVRGTVSLARSERRRIEHVFAPSSRDTLSTTPERSHTPALAYVGFGVGAAGALVGATTGILSLTKASSAKEQCEGTVCWPEARPEADSARRYATVSNISFGIGVVGVGVGLIALLTSSPQPARPERVRLEVTSAHAGAGIRLTREF